MKIINYKVCLKFCFLKKVNYCLIILKTNAFVASVIFCKSVICLLSVRTNKLFIALVLIVLITNVLITAASAIALTVIALLIINKFVILYVIILYQTKTKKNIYKNL